MYSNKRVVVTGMGTVNALGKNVLECWNQLLLSKSGVKKFTGFNIPEGMSQIAGVVENFEIDHNFRHFDRNVQFALHASREAFRDSGLSNEYVNKKKAAVYFATAISQIKSMEDYGYKLINRQSKKISYDSSDPINISSTYCPFQFNSTAAFLSHTFGFTSGYATIVTGCTGGLDALGFAMTMIRSGKADIVLTGASDAPITPLVVSSFSKIGATSKKNTSPTQASRPFDKDRDGFVLSEGAGAFIIESLDSAIERKAKIYAELKGFGSVNNCYHMTDLPEDGSSIANACKAAFKDAQISPKQIDHINAHGSSTPQNDVAETNAFYQLFGDSVCKIPVTSLKSQIGHSLSAANAIEVVFSILAIKYGIITPTINYEKPDPKCSLNIVGNYPKEQKINYILKTSSGFSGIHSSLILGSFNYA